MGLYRDIAREYSPKQAELNICKVLEQFEKRIAELEKAKEPKKAREPKEAKEQEV